MVGVAFYFEPNDVDVWSGRRLDLDAWNYAIKAAGDVDRVIIVNHTEEPLRSFDDDLDVCIVDVLPPLDGLVASIIAPSEEATHKTSLWRLGHSEIDWYVFGPASGWGEEVYWGVYVPTANDLALHAVHVASIVMTHRYSTMR